MKIYITNLNLSHLSSLSKYKISSEDLYILYSTEGIFEIISNKINKLIATDIPFETFKLNDFNLIVDKSFFKKQNIYQIPYPHNLENIERLTYQLHNKSKVKFIIEKNKLEKDMYNIYFETNEDYTHKFIQEDFLTFLSYLK